ncbi:MAG: TetR/AcrR family transcriptional regulator [Flavobacteriaceae bacterium]|jgi:AcrR family transcriptional regulator|nr:TetR/AcrR family transcriptional regulator [Bacteroidota bacterium]MDC3312470.1 TetR/AcrR family transcriptional regulator [Flavobacteriaceae bacterium]MDG1379017.1 TetR/AcrR family transcriptional regulator [Flavobacteriaceae bacterium]MDG2350700.1 TetR/AcrR family transcriptional regulator [Flavobacteriaceae bacterium]|tara:strand:- start:952 stop:1563 length:612 start_codon:yes stop_codon:yes gene_type:complete
MRKKSHKKEDYLESGRIGQKRKTRELLLATAKKMLVKGENISVEQVALVAGISKATAYRYFSNKDILLKEASLQRGLMDKDDLFGDIDVCNLNARIEKLIDYHFEVLTTNEDVFRLYLGAIMQNSVRDKKNYSRGGKRILLIAEALLPLKKEISKETFDKMVNAISLLMGIESISILKDICGLENGSIQEMWKWMIQKIITNP